MQSFLVQQGVADILPFFFRSCFSRPCRGSDNSVSFGFTLLSVCFCVSSCSEARAGDQTLIPLLYFPAGDQTLTP